jgi:hypothetical protein
VLPLTEYIKEVSDQLGVVFAIEHVVSPESRNVSILGEEFEFQGYPEDVAELKKDLEELSGDSMSIYVESFPIDEDRKGISIKCVRINDAPKETPLDFEVMINFKGSAADFFARLRELGADVDMEKSYTSSSLRATDLSRNIHVAQSEKDRIRSLLFKAGTSKYFLSWVAQTVVAEEQVDGTDRVAQTYVRFLLPPEDDQGNVKAKTAPEKE